MLISFAKSLFFVLWIFVHPREWTDCCLLRLDMSKKTGHMTAYLISSQEVIHVPGLRAFCRRGWLIIDGRPPTSSCVAQVGGKTLLTRFPSDGDVVSLPIETDVGMLDQWDARDAGAARRCDWSSPGRFCRLLLRWCVANQTWSTIKLIYAATPRTACGVSGSGVIRHIGNSVFHTCMAVWVTPCFGICTGTQWISAVFLTNNSREVVYVVILNACTEGSYTHLIYTFSTVKVGGKCISCKKYWSYYSCFV